ncbi:flavin-containing amine oxidoreductase-domain containing protein [Sordaria brevicollis]|uniref:Flavin-containing amine oxidoreductase-domain containing protein n=1 Tax=Sordaria brevicollis TaxID=83679 RepID=A0AAE0UBK3_SORBR|nr:flavin-containing amine oxidoreductase-domain containing protein [Sordaria brevicollis]
MVNSQRTRPGQTSSTSSGAAKGTKDSMESSSPRTNQSKLSNFGRHPPMKGARMPEGGHSADTSSSTSSEDIAAEIVVWTGDMNMMDSEESCSPKSPGPANDASQLPHLPQASEEPSVQDEDSASHFSSPLSEPPELSPLIAPQDDSAVEQENPITQSASSLSDQRSNPSSHAPSVTSKATTPVDADGPKELSARQESSEPLPLLVSPEPEPHAEEQQTIPDVEEPSQPIEQPQGEPQMRLSDQPTLEVVRLTPLPLTDEPSSTAVEAAATLVEPTSPLKEQKIKEELPEGSVLESARQTSPPQRTDSVDVSMEEAPVANTVMQEATAPDVPMLEAPSLDRPHQEAPTQDIVMKEPPTSESQTHESLPQETGAQSVSTPGAPALTLPAQEASVQARPVQAAPDQPTPTQEPLPRFTATTTVPTEPSRRRYNVRPKVSIPPDLSLPDYAIQCISAAEASRLNPYALHQEEYLMLRDHISHAQVTTWLNIRNGILRMWVRNPQIAVTREEAIGCAKDTRWFDAASLCYNWLVRRGYINFGCVGYRHISKKHAPNDSSSSAAPLKQRTVAVLGAGMAGLGCARQLEGLFAQYAKNFREMGEEPPRVIVIEGRNRIGGRVYSRPFATKPARIPDNFHGKRFTAEMGGMIITGFERGNPINILLRAQLGIPYRPLRPETILYDSNGKPVDLTRDGLVENLYNDCLDRVSEYKFKQPTSKLIEGNRELMDEGKDSSAEAYKTIRQVEESTAAQPHAPPVSEQSIAPQVNLVPISSDRATGRVHTEPGTPGALKAAYKAKLMGWALKQGVSEDADLDLETPAKEPDANLGSVIDSMFTQYRDIVDLTAQDYRLLNWHVANLEYSNAINYNKLSLQGWDIDAGNEWEGSHTMVIGGYQSVPKGLMLLPTPLDVRRKSPVNKITYTTESTTGPAVIECEDGFKVEADFVVNTMPLGVLKHGNIKFEPPLPEWKSSAIERLGFGVLNKVILVYKEAFWDEDRDIFGVLRNPPNRHSLDQKDYASQRGRFFQWFNVTQTSGLPVLLALMAGDAGYDTEQTCNDDLVKEATDVLRRVYGSKVQQPIEAIVTRWASDKFARGSYSSAGPNMKADDYDTMAKPIGNLFFAGEHTCGTHPATVHGAYLSGLRAASEVLEAMLGPIDKDIPTPLIIPKESSSLSLKRKAAALSSSEATTTQVTINSYGTMSSTRNPEQARLEAYDIALWDSITSQIGFRPQKPSKPVVSGYIFFSKAHYDDARKRCEAGRRPGKGKASGSEVRMMSAKMWKDATPEEKRPFEEQAEESKRVHAIAMKEWNEKAAEWDRKATELRKKYEAENPYVPLSALAAAAVTSNGKTTEDAAGGQSSPAVVASGSGLSSGRNQRRAARWAGEKVGSYAEDEGSDVDVEMTG